MDPKLAELIERLTGKLITGTVIAGAVIALAIYARPGPPTYQMVASGDAVVRLNTGSGTMIACTTARCVTLIRPGHGFPPRARPETLPKSAAPAQLPAPSPTPAAPATK